MKTYEIRSKELHEELLESGAQYCPYCGSEVTSFSCCGEIHFDSYENMSTEDQQQFLHDTLANDNDWDGVWPKEAK